MKEIFEKIYNSRHWTSKESGAGSEIKNTKTLVIELQKLLNQYHIKSFLDLPCGDYNWIKQIDMSNIQYIGGDIVEALIVENKLKYNNIDFRNINLINDVFPNVDAIFCRDCLVHFSYADIAIAIKNIKNSGSKYLMSTTFVNHNNHDIPTGRWRAINLCKAPFNFPQPISIFLENCTEGGLEFVDKSIGVWEIKNI